MEVEKASPGPRVTWIARDWLWRLEVVLICCRSFLGLCEEFRAICDCLVNILGNEGRKKKKRGREEM